MSFRTPVKKQRPTSFGSQGRAKTAEKGNKAKRSAKTDANRLAKKNAGYVDLANAGYACDTTGTLTLLATIAQGASQQQRIGKKAMYKSLQARGQITQGSTATTNDIAVCIIYDKEPTGILPAIADIFNSVNAFSFLNDTNSDRFRVLRRWSHVLSGNIATPATGKEIIDIDEYLDLKSLPVQFKAAATGAIGDIAYGALYLVTMGSSPAGTTAATASLGFRIRFFDTEG